MIDVPVVVDVDGVEQCCTKVDVTVRADFRTVVE